MALEHLLINHFKNFDTTFMGKIKNCQNITFFSHNLKKKKISYAHIYYHMYID